MEKSESLVVVLLLVAIAVSAVSIVMINNNAQVSQEVTGKAAGEVQAFNDCVVSFVLDPDTVNFGNVTQGESDNTVDDNPAPFLVNNTGTVALNVSISEDTPGALFTADTSDYNWTTSVSDVGIYLTSEVDVAIYVADDEPAGSKSTTLTFTGTDAGLNPECVA